MYYSVAIRRKLDSSLYSAQTTGQVIRRNLQDFAETIIVLVLANVVQRWIYKECKVCLPCLGHLLIERNECFHFISWT